MLFNIENSNDPIAVVRVAGGLSHTDSLHAIRPVLARLADQGAYAVALDMGQARRVTNAGLAGFLDLLLADHPLQVAAFGLPPSLSLKIARLGLSPALPVFESLEATRIAPGFARSRLAHTRALILCESAPETMAPLDDLGPIASFDLVGQSTLAHQLDQLQRYGVRDVFVAPGAADAEVRALVRGFRRRDQSVFVIDDQTPENRRWTARRCGSASLLKLLDARYGAFDDDILVLSANSIGDIDLAAMLDHHRNNEGEITVAAVPAAGGAPGSNGWYEPNGSGRVRETSARFTGCTEAGSPNTGAYFISPRVLAYLSDEPDLDIGAHLLPNVMAKGSGVQPYTGNFDLQIISRPKDYFNLTAKILAKGFAGIRPRGQEIKPGIYVADTARVSHRASIEGPCFIADGAEIAAGARIVGPCVIGADCFVDDQTIVRESMTLPGTRIEKGAIVDGQIAGGSWSISHALPFDPERPAQPLSRVVPAGVRPAAKLEMRS